MSARYPGLALLRRVPYFAALPDLVLEALAGAAVERHFDRGQVIFLEGDECARIWDDQATSDADTEKLRKSVVGCDDIAAAAWVVPALTTVAQQKAEMGRLAVERLAAMRDAVRVVQHGQENGKVPALA